MEVVLYVFMALAGVACIFTMATLAADIVREKKKNRKAQPSETDREEQEPLGAPTSSDQAEETYCAAAEEETAIRFSAAEASKTLDEKYLALSAEQQKYYDEIAAYATTREGAKRVKNDRYEEYKIRNMRLVRLLIKRGAVTCEYFLLNEDFKSLISDIKVSVKQAPTILKVVDADAVQAAKNSIDIAVKAAEDELLRRKQLRQEKRRAARAAKKTAEDAKNI